MILNDNNKELVKAGDCLVVQGQIPKYMYYMHNGALEILSASKEFEGLDQAIILSKSKRVGIIKDKIFILPMNVMFADPSSKSVRVIADSYVSKYLISEKVIQEDSSLAVTMLNHLFKMLEMAIVTDSKYTNLYKHICKISDNISLMYQTLPKMDLSERLRSKSDGLYKIFTSNNGKLPDVFDGQFLISDNSVSLRKKYTFPGLSIQSVVDQKQCNHVKKFLQIDKNVFAGLVKEDPSIVQHMIESISDNVIKVLDRIYAIHNEIDIELERLFEEKASWSVYFVENGGFDAWMGSGKLAPNFVANLLALIKKINTYYTEISGKKLIDIYPGPKKIHEYYMSNKDGGKRAKEEVEEKSGIKGAIKKIFHKDSTGGVYKNSINQIFEFALSDKEFQKGFIKALNDFKNMSNPFNTEMEGRKLRRAITKYYWDLYTQVFIRKQKEPSTPPPVKLMMKFGFLDETIVDEEQIDALHELSILKEEIKDVPIFFEEEFLSRVYNGKENPSITEMGQSYEVFKREEGKSKSSKALSGSEPATDNIAKTMYEIQHRVQLTSAICSGATATAFPVLTSMIMKINPRNSFISKGKLRSAINELMDADFSVFYREATLKLGDARELIQEEVTPSFIILPSFGNKTMLWQDLDGTNRRTRGRIVVPAFFMGDVVKSLAHTFACFRWELNRTIKGGLWADPVEGGITGLYFDYINFYNKNSKLSPEAREVIAEQFKNIRTNRDRFAEDYIQWVLFEKKGIMRLNTVVREMFYRHIPFKKELRSKLEGMPAFAEIAAKHKNISSKAIQGYERRYKKYMEKDGILPEKLQKYMDYLNS